MLHSSITFPRFKHKNNKNNNKLQGSNTPQKKISDMSSKPLHPGYTACIAHS